MLIEEGEAPVAVTSPRVNGPHDLGGVQGLGPVRIESDEPVFHELWEGRVLGTALGAVVSRAFTVDEARARVEELHPIAYLKMSYYEQWLYFLETNLLAHGVLTVDEIEGRLRTVAADPDVPLPDRRDDSLVEAIKAVMSYGVPLNLLTRELDRPPRYGSGDRVRTKVIRLDQPGVQHTRLPGYAQDRIGVVQAVWAAIPLPDASVAGEAERPEHVYTIQFRACDLWPDDGLRHTVSLDLWESYLEPAGSPSEAKQDGEQP